MATGTYQHGIHYFTVEQGDGLNAPDPTAAATMRLALDSLRLLLLIADVPKLAAGIIDDQGTPETVRLGSATRAQVEQAIVALDAIKQHRYLPCERCRRVEAVPACYVAHTCAECTAAMESRAILDEAMFRVCEGRKADHPCEHGHLDCATSDGGACTDALVATEARRLRESGWTPHHETRRHQTSDASHAYAAGERE